MLSSNPKKTPWPIEEVEFEVSEVDESQYKSLLCQIFLDLQRVKELLGEDIDIKE